MISAKIIILLIVILLSGCHHYFMGDLELSEIDTVEEALIWTAINIKYVSDETDYWQTPIETLDLMGGDCEDISILALYLIYENVGIKGKMVLGICNGIIHAWVFVGGEHWEPQTANIIDIDKYERYRFINYDDIEQLDI